jgi:enoyl-CoA hydratase/carnithine racemase
MLALTSALDGRCAVITLDRPAALNALNGSLLDALDRALDDAERDSGIRLLILNGGEKAFSVGADLKEDLADPDERVRRMHAFAVRLRSYPKISIAAIEGWALGGGLEIAMGCTFRVAAPGAMLGLPEIKLGVMPGFGGTQLLPRLIGATRALEMLCDGEAVDAETALAIGLVDRLAESKGDALRCAQDFAKRFVELSPVAQHAARRAVEGGQGLPFDEALAVERRELIRLRGAEPAPEGLRAFREKGSRLQEDPTGL